MEGQDIKLAFSEMLKVKSPWRVKEVKIYDENKVVDVYIDYEEKSQFRCSECGKMCKVHDSKVHRWRYLDIFEYPCYLNIKIPRTKCSEHGVRILKETPWGRMGSHYSYFLESKVMQLSAEMTMSALSKYLGEPANNLWRVFKYYVNKAIDEQLDLTQVRRIAVDEKSQKRGHTYVTVFTDLDTGNVILVKEGRKKEVFSELKKWLIEKNGLPENIELFSMDMSVSYKAGREEYFSHSEEVFDRFHVKKALNEAVDSVRKKEVKESEELKKTKYWWLKSPGKLTDYQRDKLNDFLRESTLDTAIAYQMKTAFDQLWMVHPHVVQPVLENWLKNALLSRLKPFEKFVNTVRNNYNGILKSIKTSITNAVSEGINSKIQMAKARARGYANMDNFKTMIYFLGNNFDFDFH
jgi:transposase